MTCVHVRITKWLAQELTGRQYMAMRDEVSTLNSRDMSMDVCRETYDGGLVRVAPLALRRFKLRFPQIQELHDALRA